MKRKKFALIIVCVFMLNGCGSTAGTKNDIDVMNSAAEAGGAESNSQKTDFMDAAEKLSIQKMDVSEMFSDRDKKTDYEEEHAAIITLEGESAVCSSNAVTISESMITIKDEGTYILSGTLRDGIVVVDAGKDDKVQLVLDGVQISNRDSAAVFIRKADKVFMTLVSEKENALANGGSYENTMINAAGITDGSNVDAVIFSKADLTLNGAGTLTIEAPAGHGIVSKDDLVLTGGSYHITAENHGLSGKDSVRIADGTYNIVSGKDGIHADNAEKEEKGFLYIADGNFQITAEGKGISSSGLMQMDGGSFVIDAQDDAIHSDRDIAIVGGSYEIETGDDGIHADHTVLISDGSLTISNSYEGIEGQDIYICGGEISLTSSDDGLNAAGGTDGSGEGMRGDFFGGEEDASITISGGRILINAEGDGIDSNGSLLVSGGEIYVSGPTTSKDAPVDYSGNAVVTGGVLLAAGASGMAQNFGKDSTQAAMLIMTDGGQAGDEITLTDMDNNVLISWKTEKKYDCVLISCPELALNGTYTLKAGNHSEEVTLTELIYGEGFDGGFGRGMGGHGGFDGNMRGGRPDDTFGGDRMPERLEGEFDKDMKGRQDGAFDEGMKRPPDDAFAGEDKRPGNLSDKGGK